MIINIMVKMIWYYATNWRYATSLYRDREVLTLAEKVDQKYNRGDRSYSPIKPLRKDQIRTKESTLETQETK